MNSSLGYNFPVSDIKLNQKLVLPTPLRYKNSLLLNIVAISRRSAINYEEFSLGNRIGVGVLIGAIIGGILTYLFGDNLFLTEDYRQLLFSIELWSITGFSNTMSSMLAGVVTGILLGGIVGAISNFEAIE